MVVDDFPNLTFQTGSLSLDIRKHAAFLSTLCHSLSRNNDIPPKKHFKNKMFPTSKTRLDQEHTSPAFNKHASCHNAKQLGQNQNSPNSLNFKPLLFLQGACLLNPTLKRFNKDVKF